LVWAPRDHYDDRSKAGMTELHAIHVIHRGVAITFCEGVRRQRHHPSERDGRMRS
jgi:hypothetical protein